MPWPPPIMIAAIISVLIGNFPGFMMHFVERVTPANVAVAMPQYKPEGAPLVAPRVRGDHGESAESHGAPADTHGTAAESHDQQSDPHGEPAPPDPHGEPETGPEKPSNH